MISIHEIRFLHLIRTQYWKVTCFAQRLRACSHGPIIVLAIEHNQCINITAGGMIKRLRQPTNRIKTKFGPKPYSTFVAHSHKIKLHGLIPQLNRNLLRMLTHGRGKTFSPRS